MHSHNLIYRLPEKYSSVKVPAKLPPLKQPLVVNSLPILGYLEQKVATCITNSLTAAGCFKPKLPFTDPYTSALTYVAYHLKGEPYPYSDILLIRTFSLFG